MESALRESEGCRGGCGVPCGEGVPAARRRGPRGGEGEGGQSGGGSGEGSPREGRGGRGKNAEERVWRPGRGGRGCCQGGSRLVHAGRAAQVLRPS